MATIEIDTTKAEAFVERLFGSALGAVDVASVYLGDRLGLYRSLHERGSLTAPGLADAAGIHPRYAREWCEQQAVSGILEVDDVAAEPDARRFTLPAEHAEALVDPDSPFSIAPLARAVVSAALMLPQLLEAYRTGGGVPWSAFGQDGIESQGDFNRPWLRGSLAQEYLPAVADVHERLTAGARVVDVACGVGWAGISLAKEYPNSTVVGLDPDDSSIALARRFASENDVSGSTTFEVHDCAKPLPGGPFDIAIMIEALHDVSRPVEILSSIRSSLSPDGTLIVADEKVGETFTAPGDPVEAFMYGASLLMCLPAGMSEQPSAATGTVIRPQTVEMYAKEAGFSRVEVLEQIEHPMLRFYRLHK
ncbi:MAG: methyltransferase domain-containing protein [Actinomycetota bacterium]